MPALVSVVVPVYNGMAHLSETISSIIKQTYRDLEIVLVDGGSTDGSREWIATLDDPRIRVVLMPPGTSAAENWTASCREASGEYVKLLCQDDVLAPEAIELQVQDLEQAPVAVMAVAQRDIIDAQGRVLVSQQGGTGLTSGVMQGDSAVRAAYLVGTNVLGEPLAVLFRRDALIEQLPWDDSIPLMLDVDMYSRVAHGKRIVVRKESVGAFRVSTSSWSTRLARQHTKQYSEWQRSWAPHAQPPITQRERVRGYVGMHARALMRRLAYAWLHLRGSLRSPGPAGSTSGQGTAPDADTRLRP